MSKSVILPFTILIAVFVVVVGFWAGVIYVAMHFIAKWW